MAKKFKLNWGAITEKIKEAEKGGSNFKDDRIYNLKPGDDGSAQAVIRFLPNKDLESIPFVKVFTHAFKSHGSWFINGCPTTIGKDCPVCKANSELWDDDPETVRQRCRKTSYYSNILVIKDKQNPDNEDKVFLYRYGKKIHEKIMDAIEGKFDDPMMVFDPFEGANFKLMVKTTKTGDKSYPNYDSSSFSDSTALSETVVEKAVEALYDVNDFVKPEKFKSYDELADRFVKVTGDGGSTKTIESEKTTESVNNDSTSNSKDQPIEAGVDKDAFLKKLRGQID